MRCRLASLFDAVATAQVFLVLYGGAFFGTVFVGDVSRSHHEIHEITPRARQVELNDKKEGYVAIQYRMHAGRVYAIDKAVTAVIIILSEAALLP